MMAMSLCIAALGLLATTGSGKPNTVHANQKEDVMSENHESNDKPRIVLIHGAWADGSSWSGVIQRLQKADYTVIAPQFPLTSLAAGDYLIELNAKTESGTAQEMIAFKVGR